MSRCVRVAWCYATSVLLSDRFDWSYKSALSNQCVRLRICSALIVNCVGAAAVLLSATMVPRHASADIGVTHNALVSEFASFNTPGVLDGLVYDIVIEGDTVFIGGSFTRTTDPLSDTPIDQPYLFAYSKSTGNIIRDFDQVLNNEVLALETTG